MTSDERIARVEALRRDDLASFYGERYGSASLVVVVVGDVEADRILDRLEKSFDSWARGPALQIPLPEAPPPAPANETVRMPDKASADVVLAMPADLKRTDPDYLAASLANAALGQSSLTSRLGVRVRAPKPHLGFTRASLRLTSPTFLVSRRVERESHRPRLTLARSGASPREE